MKHLLFIVCFFIQTDSIKVLKVDRFRDGGTTAIKTNKGIYCIDYRLETTTRGKLFFGYPDTGKIVTDTSLIKEIYKQVGKFKR